MTKTTTTKRVRAKKVKAWATVSKENGYEDIQTHDSYHVMSIFETRKKAFANRPKGWKAGHLWTVVPCTITYSLPTKRGGKK